MGLVYRPPQVGVYPGAIRVSEGDRAPVFLRRAYPVQQIPIAGHQQGTMDHPSLSKAHEV